MKPRSAPPIDLGVLSELAPELAETFVSLASDIALVLDAGGVIRKVAQAGTGPLAPGAGDWVGRNWAETVTGEARVKIEQLLREVAASGVTHRSEINHPSPNGADIPIAYAAVRLGAGGPVLAVGRDLRAITAIQQQFVEAQQEIEREYWKHRQAESRYRVLFRVATDAVLVVDSESLRILDANQAANDLFGIELERLIGMDLASAIDASSRPAIGEMLATARATGLSGEIRAWLAGRKVSARVSATPFRSAHAMLLLVRARALNAGAETTDTRDRLIKLVERTPDAVVVVDAAGRVLMANPAFIELAQFGDESHAKGRHLADLVGTGLAEVLAATRNRGIATGRELTLRGLRGRLAPIEVSATVLAEEEQESIGLTIRVRAGDGANGTGLHAQASELATAIETLTDQLGRLGLTELMASVSKNAERHFIQAAMKLADRDRSAAARILGVSAAELDRRLRNDVESSGHGSDGVSNTQH